MDYIAPLFCFYRSEFANFLHIVYKNQNIVLILWQISYITPLYLYQNIVYIFVKHSIIYENMMAKAERSLAKARRSLANEKNLQNPLIEIYKFR